MIYHVGGLFDQAKTSWTEGMAYNYHAGQHVITLVWPRLTVHEVAAVDQEPLQFALYAEDDQIVLFLKLGAASGYQELPFSVWLADADDRTIPAPATPGEHALMMLFLIAAENGRIAAMRCLTISAEMTDALQCAMRRQANSPFDRAAYEQRLATLRQQYPTPDDFVADTQRVRIRCHGGD